MKRYGNNWKQQYAPSRHQNNSPVKTDPVGKTGQPCIHEITGRDDGQDEWNEYQPDIFKSEGVERPPIIEIAEYREKFKVKRLDLVDAIKSRAKIAWSEEKVVLDRRVLNRIDCLHKKMPGPLEVRGYIYSHKSRWIWPRLHKNETTNKRK